MISEHKAAALALLAAVESPDWPRLAASAREAVAARLSEGVPPTGLVEHLLSVRYPELVRDLTSGRYNAHVHASVRESVVTGDPVDAWRAMSGGGQWRYRDWERLLARAVPGEPVWEEMRKQEVIGALRFGLAGVLALSPFPEHRELALKRSAARLTLREQARLLASAQRDAGDGEVVRLVNLHDLSIKARALEALAGEGIEALAAELDGTEAAIAAWRGEAKVEAVVLTRERADLDWSLVASAHAEEPFGGPIAAALCTRDDCPHELRIALLTARPAEVAETFPDPPVELFSLPLKGSARTKALKTLTVRFLKDGRVAELIAHARPAALVLEASRRADIVDPLTWKLQPVHAVLGRILAETVGSDVGAWRTLRRLLKGHKGTVAELCAAAAAAPDADGPWPDAEPMPAADAKSSLTGARKAFVVLLDAAGVETQLALLPHLDERTAADLFTHGVQRREWFEHVINDEDPRRRLAFVRSRGTLAIAQIQRLLDLGEPELTGAIALRRPMSAVQITHIMSGRAFPGEEVFPPELRARFLATTGGWTSRHAIACADPEVQRHILRHVRVRGMVPQLRLLLDLWDRAGLDAMVSLVEADLDPLKYTRAEFQTGVVKRVRKMAAAEAPDAAREELRAYLAERETPEWQIRRLQGADNFDRESHDWFFAEIAAAEQEKRLGALEGVRAAPGGEQLVELMDPRRFPGTDLAAGVPFAEVVEAHPLTDADYTRRWIGEGIAAGTLTWTEVFTHGHPAGHVLVAAKDDAVDRWLPELRALVGTLDLTAEAQLVALEILRDFAGTVPELLATAVAVTTSAAAPSR